MALRCLFSSSSLLSSSSLCSLSSSLQTFRWKSDHRDKTLYLVPAPIGNDDDLTLRAAHLLPRVDVVACEDTRKTLRLLRNHNIHTNVQRLDQNIIFQSRADNLFHRYNEIAFMTDAGTPGISDPGGNEIHELAERHGFHVVALPGPSAVTTALSLSGLPIERFVFEGFLPKSGRQRELQIQEISFENRTVVLFESPRRLEKMLKDLLKFCGPEREVVVLREMTKTFEEKISGCLEEVLREVEERGGVKGEVVVVVGPVGYRSLNGEESEEEERREENNLTTRTSSTTPTTTTTTTTTTTATPTLRKEEIVWYQRFHEKGLRGKQLVLALTAVGFRKQQAYDLVHKIMKEKEE